MTTDFLLAPFALITWLSWCLPGSSTVKSLFSPSHTLLFEASGAHTRLGRRHAPPSGSYIYRYYFEFVPKEDVPSPLPFISISMDPCLYLSYLLGYNSVLSYLFCSSNCSCSGHWELFQMSFCVQPLILFFCFCFLEHFLTFWYSTMLQAHLLFSLSEENQPFL